MQLFDNVKNPKAILLATDKIDEKDALIFNDSGFVVVAGYPAESTGFFEKTKELISAAKDSRANYDNLPVLLLGVDKGALLAQHMIQVAGHEFFTTVLFNPTYITGLGMYKLWYINKSHGLAGIPKNKKIKIFATGANAKDADLLFNRYLEHALKNIEIKIDDDKTSVSDWVGEMAVE